MLKIKYDARKVEVFINVIAIFVSGMLIGYLIAQNWR